MLSITHTTLLKSLSSSRVNPIHILANPWLQTETKASNTPLVHFDLSTILKLHVHLYLSSFEKQKIIYHLVVNLSLLLTCSYFSMHFPKP